MHKLFFVVILLLPIIFSSCGNVGNVEVSALPSEHKDEIKLEIEVLVKDSTLNVRAMDFGPNNEISFVTSDGRIGMLYFDKDSNYFEMVFLKTKYQAATPNFRAISHIGCHIFAVGVGSPALLYKAVNPDSIHLVYKETHEKAFYDSLEFWNEDEGIAIGDPTEDCMSVIITRDGGETWEKLSCDDLPKSRDGEAAFAASDTNIAIVGNDTWVATGGVASRILYSPDKGKSWSVYETPIIQGETTTGIYSLDFYDKNHGFAIGGDYTKPADSSANKIRTSDGGKTWELVAENQAPGYRSCVQYVPNGNTRKLVTVGFKGIDYTSDSGETWQHLSDKGFYTIRFLNDSVAFAGGNGSVAKLIFRQE
ncbi:MAG: oxidoreductase [Bacteroidota bacterium]